jgi:hypothetical protein
MDSMAAAIRRPSDVDESEPAGTGSIHRKTLPWLTWIFSARRLALRD